MRNLLFLAMVHGRRIVRSATLGRKGDGEVAIALFGPIQRVSWAILAWRPSNFIFRRFSFQFFRNGGSSLSQKMWRLIAGRAYSGCRLYGGRHPELSVCLGKPGMLDDILIQRLSRL